MMFEVKKATLAVTKVEAMVQFLTGVFDVQLQPVSDGVFVGSWFGLPLMLCTNEYAQVKAEQSRLQLDVSCANLEAALQRVRAFGGEIRERVGDSATVVDPDGNTWVLHEHRLRA